MMIVHPHPPRHHQVRAVLVVAPADLHHIRVQAGATQAVLVEVAIHQIFAGDDLTFVAPSEIESEAGAHHRHRALQVATAVDRAPRRENEKLLVRVEINVATY